MKIVATPIHRSLAAARAREVFVDDFFGANECRSTDDAWRRYFGAFASAARRHC